MLPARWQVQDEMSVLFNAQKSGTVTDAMNLGIISSQTPEVLARLYYYQPTNRPTLVSFIILNLNLTAILTVKPA
jgi:hypothetical protein